MKSGEENAFAMKDLLDSEEFVDNVQNTLLSIKANVCAIKAIHGMKILYLVISSVKKIKLT